MKKSINEGKQPFDLMQMDLPAVSMQVPCGVVIDTCAFYFGLSVNESYSKEQRREWLSIHLNLYKTLPIEGRKIVRSACEYMEEIGAPGAVRLMKEILREMLDSLDGIEDDF